MRETEKKLTTKIEKLTKELDHARNEAIVARTERETMRKKCEFMDEQVLKMSIRSKQAVELVSNRKEAAAEGKGILTRTSYRGTNMCFNSRFLYSKRSRTLYRTFGDKSNTTRLRRQNKHVRKRKAAVYRHDREIGNISVYVLPTFFNHYVLE